MLLSLFVVTSVASVEASRVQIETHTALEAKWGASCESLQGHFHTQVQTCQTALNSANSAESMSMVSQGRLMMRMYGLVRTLRRARECDWVVENNSEDIEEMRGMTQQLIADNPCGDAARAEFEAGAADQSLQAIARALSILGSDNCEAVEIPEMSEMPEGEEEPSQEMDDQVQDEIDALMDAEEEGGAAFIQMSQSRSLRGFMRGVGVFFLTLFLVLACAGSVALIVFFLTAILVPLVLSVSGRHMQNWLQFGGSGPRFSYFAFLAGAGGGLVGLAGCTHQLYDTFTAVQ